MGLARSRGGDCGVGVRGVGVWGGGCKQGVLVGIITDDSEVLGPLVTPPT